MVWPWTLTFWPKNAISSSLSQDAPVTKVWRKSVNRYWRYRGNIKIWDLFGHSVTLTYDLLNPKSNQFISVPRCTSDKSLAKIRHQILEISWKHKTTTWITDGRTHGQRHGRTTRKHIASAGAYRRRRLKKNTEYRGGISKMRLNKRETYQHLTECLHQSTDPQIYKNIQRSQQYSAIAYQTHKKTRAVPNIDFLLFGRIRIFGFSQWPNMNTSTNTE